jgi:hypothetical protein
MLASITAGAPAGKNRTIVESAKSEAKVISVLFIELNMPSAEVLIHYFRAN